MYATVVVKVDLFRVPERMTMPFDRMMKLERISISLSNTTKIPQSSLIIQNFSPSSSFQSSSRITGRSKGDVIQAKRRGFGAVGESKTVGRSVNVRFFTMGTCFFAATILKDRRKIRQYGWSRRVERDA
jgi:hypothetical protein